MTIAARKEQILRIKQASFQSELTQELEQNIRDGSYQLVHFEIAEDEDETAWTSLFDNLIARGLAPDAVQLVVSDGTRGLLAALKARSPQAQQRRPFMMAKT